MNKYQEAYSYIKHYCELDDDCVGWPLYQRSINSLKELVDKATPMKPIIKVVKGSYDPVYFRYCPVCNFSSVEKDYANFCPGCGQKLDWNTENER
jgi:hypothetical protein